MQKFIHYVQEKITDETMISMLSAEGVEFFEKAGF